MAAPTPEQYSRVSYLYDTLTPKPTVRFGSLENGKFDHHKVENSRMQFTDFMPSIGAFKPWKILYQVRFQRTCGTFLILARLGAHNRLFKNKHKKDHLMRSSELTGQNFIGILISHII